MGIGRVVVMVAIGLCVLPSVTVTAEPAAGATITTSAAFDTLPATLFGPDTALACYVDLTAAGEADLAAALTGLDEVLAPTHGQTEAAEAIAELVSGYGQFRSELMNAGGTGLVVLADVTPQNNADPIEPIRPVLLVAVSENAEPMAVLRAIEPLLDEITTASDDATLLRIAPRWMRVAGVGRLGSGHTDGAAVHAAALTQAMTAHAGRPLRLALRMTPGLRDRLRRAAGLPGDGESGPTVFVDPLVAVVRDAARAVAPLEQLSIAVRVADEPSVEARFWFPTDDEARAFSTASDGFLNLTRQLMGADVDDTPARNGANDPRVEVERLLAAVRLTRDGRQLHTDLDTGDLASAIKLGPSLAMMLLMGMPEP